MSMINIPSTKKDPQYRYQMPRLVSKYEGRGNGVKTSVMNIKDVAAALHRPPSYIMKWFGCEIGSKSSYEDNSRQGVVAIIMGHHDNETLQELLDKFIHMFVLCPRCEYPEMGLKLPGNNKKNIIINGKCTACGYEGHLKEASVHKMAKFVAQNPMNEGEGAGFKQDDVDKSKSDRQLKRSEKSKKKSSTIVEDSDIEISEDDTSEKKKKKKKDKKEKKSKKEKKKKSKKSKSNESSDDETRASDDASNHKDSEVIEVIESVCDIEVTSDDVEKYCEDIRLKFVSAQLDRKLYTYCFLQAFFTKKDISESIGDIFKSQADMIHHFIEKQQVSVNELFCSLELYIKETSKTEEEIEKNMKSMLKICKVIQDEDMFKELEKDFLETFYESKSLFFDTSVHQQMKDATAKFAEHCAEDSDSDSGSDSD